MDRGTKIALGFGVLVMGILAAFAFRRDPGGGANAMPDPHNQLVLRQPALPGVAEAPDSRAGGQGRQGGPTSKTKPPSAKPVTILTPIDQGAPPPALATSYPGGPARTAATPSADSRWGTSMSVGLPSPRQAGGRFTIHTVVDGDSLESLAEQYLGTDQRWPEIYEANRQLLRSPDVLPIGATLRIPVTRRGDQNPPVVFSDRPPAPVGPPSSPFAPGGVDPR